MASTKKIRGSISSEKKLKIIDDVENKIDYEEIVKNYNLKNKSNINRLLEKKEKYKEIACKLNKSKVKAFKRNRGSNYESLDKELFFWIMAKRLHKAPINGFILRNKAIFFANQLLI
jgi:hypothetical protein